MNAKSTVSGIGSATVPGAIIVGAALLVSSVAGIQAQRDRYRAEAATPNPTTTVTAPPAVRPAPVSTTTVAAPTASPTPATTVLLARDRIAAMPHNASGDLSHVQARPPSTPQPSPAAAPCSGQTLTVRVLKRACVSIGGGS